MSAAMAAADSNFFISTLSLERERTLYSGGGLKAAAVSPAGPLVVNEIVATLLADNRRLSRGLQADVRN
jgi:hypothetical protein